MEREFTFVVESSQRLDVYLSKKLSQSRSQISALIKKGGIFLEGEEVFKPGAKLKPSQILKVILPQIERNLPKEVDFDIEVLYEDDAILVLNKPSGVVVHFAPSVKEATLVDWLKKRGVSLSTISAEERHGIVHRLDKGTSGVMVVAKTNKAHTALSKQLEDKSMGRYYLAVITPPLKEEVKFVECPIGRNPANRVKMACVKGGKSAKSAFAPIVNSFDEKEQLIACKLFTGRTHQIRVHLERISRHIVGDEVYGKNIGKTYAERILLHAFLLYLKHPISGEKLLFRADLDETMQKYIRKKFKMEKFNEKTLAELTIRRFDTSIV